MIDIHSHVLPEIDDGASSLDVSVAMLDALAAIGYRAIVATPHLTGPLTTVYQDAVTDAFDAVRPLADARGIELKRGFEVRLSPELPARLRAGEPITLGASNAVLVDLPTGGWLYDLDETLFNIQASGFRPVLAHPERYPMIQRRPRYGRELAERGVAMQVTIGSFAGIFGRRAKRTAEALLREGAVHIVATDAHSAVDRLAAVPAGLSRLGEIVGTVDVQTITVENGEHLLADGDIIEPAPPAASASFDWRKLLPMVRE